MKSLLFISMLFCLGLNLQSQVNTEVMRPSFDTVGTKSNTQFNFGLSSGNVSFNTIGLSSRIDMKRNTWSGFLFGSYNYSEANDDLVAQNGFIHLRLSLFQYGNILTESFVQSEFNSFTLLRSRYLIGANERFVIELDSNNLIAFGTGLMFEQENLNETPLYSTDKWRWNNYINFQININGIFKLVTSSYFQLDVFATSDFRFLNETSLEFALDKNFKFIFSLVYRYDEEPPSGITHYDLLITNGIRVSF